MEMWDGDYNHYETSGRDEYKQNFQNIKRDNEQLYHALKAKQSMTAFYGEKAKEVYRLIDHVNDHQMYEHGFDPTRVKKEYVKEVIEIYNKILEPTENDKQTLLDALDQMIDHLNSVIESYKQKRSDDLEIYKNFLGLKFNINN